MAVIYFTRHDYRRAMQDPGDPARSHAICRKLTGVPPAWPVREQPGCSRMCHWYGAHYYAACAVSSVRDPEEAEEFWRRALARETAGCDGRIDPPMSAGIRALWELALRRVKAIWPEAQALASSVLW